MKKLHAGHAVIAGMAAFILIMTQFMVRAYYNQESLVAEDYYAKELRYQEQIDKMHNAVALEEGVTVSPLPGRLVVDLPKVFLRKEVTGELFLMRPSDERSDLRVPFRVDGNGRFTVDTSKLLKGAYKLQLEWRADSVDYLLEEDIFLP